MRLSTQACIIPISITDTKPGPPQLRLQWQICPRTESERKTALHCTPRTGPYSGGDSHSFTFQGDPVVLPLAPGHELQLPVLVEGDEGLEGEPASPSDHPLFFLEQQVELLQWAQGLFTAGLRALRRLTLLTAATTTATAQSSSLGFQLPHEVLVDVLAQGVRPLVQGAGWFAARRQGLGTRAGPGLGVASGVPVDAGTLGGRAGVGSEAIHTTVKALTGVFIPGLLKGKRTEKRSFWYWDACC